MAWASFKNSKRYYRKVREGKKVRSIYLGNGEEAHAAAKAVEEAAKQRMTLREIKMQDKSLDDRISSAVRECSALTANSLKTAGFYQYQREWKIKKPPANP
jgi:hypothetical protein